MGLAFLVLISIIDVKTYDKEKGYIPSIITTLFLIIAFLLTGFDAVFSGILAGLIALLLTDLEFWGGIADFKVFVASGMLFGNPLKMVVFAGCVTIFGFIYKVIILRILKKKDVAVPFIPVILVAFLLIALMF